MKSENINQKSLMKNINPFDSSDLPNDEDLPLAIPILGALMTPKPFGIMWTKEQVIRFLKSRGYMIIERSDHDKKTYPVAVKKGSQVIPDGESNIGDVFVEEVQEILMNWLLRIANDDNDKSGK